MLASPLPAGCEKARPVRVFSRLLFLCLLALSGSSLAFWGRDYDEPPPIIRLEPPSQQEVKALGFGNQALNEQVTRFGLAKHVPLISDWSKAQSGKLLASWNPLAADGKHPTLVIQHGGVGGPGSTDYGHARWFLARGFNVLVLDRGKRVFFGNTKDSAVVTASASQLYIRVDGDNISACEFVRKIAPNSTVSTMSDWVIVSCRATEKAMIVESLVVAGIKVLDFRVEEAVSGQATFNLPAQDGDE